MEEKLITAMASFPIVYDASLSGYKDTLKRSDAWKKVAEIVGSDGGFDFFLCMH